MDQIKIGTFLKQLRKEKGITQEKLAEELGVSGRTISRWETGSNMPDIDLLIILAESYNVEISEILNGERKSENMTEQEKETILKVSEYNNIEKEKLAKTIFRLLVAGLVSFTIFAMVDVMELFKLPDFLNGLTLGISYGCMIVSVLYAGGVLNKACEVKKRVMGKTKKD